MVGTFGTPGDRFVPRQDPQRQQQQQQGFPLSSLLQMQGLLGGGGASPAIGAGGAGSATGTGVLGSLGTGTADLFGGSSGAAGGIGSFGTALGPLALFLGGLTLARSQKEKEGSRREGEANARVKEIGAEAFQQEQRDLGEANRLGVFEEGDPNAPHTPFSFETNPDPIAAAEQEARLRALLMRRGF